MTAPRWTFASAGRGAWSLSYGGVVIATDRSQRHAVADAIRRLVADLDDVIAERDEHEATADKLATWALSVRGRAGG